MVPVESNRDGRNVGNNPGIAVLHMPEADFETLLGGFWESC